MILTCSRGSSWLFTSMYNVGIKDGIRNPSTDSTSLLITLRTVLLNIKRHKKLMKICLLFNAESSSPFCDGWWFENLAQIFIK